MYRFVESPNRYRGRYRKVSRIGIHSTETGEDTAPGVANFFARPASKASAHVVVDRDEAISCVKYADTAWAMPHVNADGFHVELCGHASQTPQQWLQPGHGLNVLAWGACVCAQAVVLGRFLGQPFDVRWLSDDELRNGTGYGFVMHRKATRVLGPAGGHTDPGKGFVDGVAMEFLGMVEWWIPRIQRVDFA